MVQKTQTLVSINSKGSSKELPNKEKLDYIYLQKVGFITVEKPLFSFLDFNYPQQALDIQSIKKQLKTHQNSFT